MFGLSTWELLLILVVALIFIGPAKLPEVARSLGRGVRKVRQAMAGLEDEVRESTRDFRDTAHDLQETARQVKQDALRAAEPDPAPPAAPEAGAAPAPAPLPEGVVDMQAQAPPPAPAALAPAPPVESERSPA